MVIKRIIDTIKYLKPIQIFSYVKIKKNSFIDMSLKPLTIKRYSLFIEELDGKVDDAIEGDKITLLHETADIPYESWEVKEKSHLWNFNLHYLEHCTEKMLDKYNLQAKDARHPYTISLRIVNVLIKYPDRAAWVYPQYRYLIDNQETRLLANHYFENLKTIVICSIIFDEQKVYHKYIKKLLKQCEEQILEDGFHCELSPMYQKIILEDLIRVAYVLMQSNKTECKIIITYIKKMISATASLENGFNRTPLFNDSGDNVSKSKEVLLCVAKRLFGIEPELQNDLLSSGYHKLYDANISLIFDSGKVGPDYMPGHAHCDCQSFELAISGEPVLVNSGTYAYQTELRAYFRSTSAHNTVVINNHEQSECWGEHRVARRIKIIDDNSYYNYVGEWHKRSFQLHGRKLTVLDETSPGKIKSYLHIAPGYENKIKITPINCEYEIVNYNYSPEFGVIKEAVCYIFSWTDNKNNKHGYEVEL